MVDLRDSLSSAHLLGTLCRRLNLPHRGMTLVETLHRCDVSSPDDRLMAWKASFPTRHSVPYSASIQSDRSDQLGYTWRAHCSYQIPQSESLYDAHDILCRDSWFLSKGQGCNKSMQWDGWSPDNFPCLFGDGNLTHQISGFARARLSYIAAMMSIHSRFQSPESHENLVASVPT